MKISLQFDQTLYSILETKTQNIVVHRVDQDESLRIDIRYPNNLAAAFRVVEGMKLIDIDQFTLVDSGYDGFKLVRIIKHKDRGFYLVINQSGDVVSSWDEQEKIARGPMFESLGSARSLIGKKALQPSKTRARGRKVKEAA